MNLATTETVERAGAPPLVRTRLYPLEAFTGVAADADWITMRKYSSCFTAKTRYDVPTGGQAASTEASAEAC